MSFDHTHQPNPPSAITCLCIGRIFCSGNLRFLQKFPHLHSHLVFFVFIQLTLMQLFFVLDCKGSESDKSQVEKVLVLVFILQQLHHLLLGGPGDYLKRGT